MAEGIAAKQWALAGSAPVACIACRRLKMRCIGAENPPCTRCIKAKRECVVNPSRRGLQKPSRQANNGGRQQTTKPSGERAHGDDTSALPSRPASTQPQFVVSGAHRPQSLARSPQSISSHTTSQGPRTTSSIYSTGILATLSSPENSSADHTPQNKPVFSVENGAHSSPPVTHVSDETLEDLVRFFRKKLIYFIPLLDNSDLDDISYVVKHRRPLAYCAALVASNYVPGGGNLRKQLVPHVCDFLASLEGPLEQDEAVVWTQLQAYAILYAYRPSTDIFSPTYDHLSRRLNHWVLKSAIESFALRLGLHYSLDEVRNMIREGAFEIWKTYAFQKYVYWCWLFTMSHHFSIVTESPPSIRADYSIRIACSLLAQVDKPARITRMLAEVDLCMLWNAAGQSLPGLDEWWCPPPEDQDPEQATKVLDDADAALEVWSRRWGFHGAEAATYPGIDVTNQGAVLYHLMATRFWLRTFAARIIHHSQTTSNAAFMQNPRSIELNAQLTLKSAEAAEQCCRYLFEISPLKRDSARYMADLGFAFIAFCGIYIVRIYELFGNTFPILVGYIKTVEDMGHLLTEMAVGSNKVPIIYGKRVLERLAQASAPSAVVPPPALENGPTQEYAIDLQWIDDIFHQSSTSLHEWG